MKPEITVTVQVTAADLFKFMARHTYTKLSGIVGVLFSLGAFGILIATWGTVNPQYIIILIICSLMFTVLSPWMLWGRARRQAKRNPSVCQPMTYTFGGSSLTMEQGDQKVKVPYDALYRVKATKNYVYIYSNTIRANILPKRQLEGKADEIVNRIRRLLRFQAQASMLAIYGAAFSPDAVQKVCSIELHGGLSRVNVHLPSGHGVKRARRISHAAG